MTEHVYRCSCCGVRPAQHKDLGELYCYLCLVALRAASQTELTPEARAFVARMKSRKASLELGADVTFHDPPKDGYILTIKTGAKS